MPMLEVEGLSYNYPDGHRALHGVSLSVGSTRPRLGVSEAAALIMCVSYSAVIAVMNYAYA